jgi:hypothetical protein
MTSLQWRQVHAWRLAQHGLAPRLPMQDLVAAVTRTGGIQAQVMSAAELALCARVEGRAPHDVQSALFQEHTLIKTWAMRATLHLVAAHELPLYIAARDWRLMDNWVNYFAEFGITGAQIDDYLQAIPHVLEQGPLTRTQLAEAVAKHTGATQMRDFIVSESWGTPLKPSAYRGDLSVGSGQGKTVTFVNPKTWMEPWQPLDSQQALQEMVRRYLRAFGPATVDDFRFWWGGTRSQAKQLFKSLADELEEVDVEGWQAYALRATLPQLKDAEPVERILLLPLFDAYTIGSPRNCESFLAPTHKSKVFNLQGWTFAVVLVSGSIQGVWRSTAKRGQVIISVNLFTESTPAVRHGIEAEADRLSHLFGKAVALEYV